MIKMTNPGPLTPLLIYLLNMFFFLKDSVLQGLNN